MEQLKFNLRVAPIQGFEPATVRIEAIIPPEVGNTIACIVVDGAAFFTSSCWELEGDKAPAVFRREFRDVPAGEYVTALNVENDGKVKSVTRQFLVQRSGPE